MKRTKKRKHGGARKGSGRKRSALPREILDKLGPIPVDDPLGQARWWSTALAVATWGLLNGRPWFHLIDGLRATARAAGRVIPSEIIFRAAQVLRDKEAS